LFFGSFKASDWKGINMLVNSFDTGDGMLNDFKGADCFPFE
jgi:hypothetical protein